MSAMRRERLQGFTDFRTGISGHIGAYRGRILPIAGGCIQSSPESALEDDSLGRAISNCCSRDPWFFKVKCTDFSSGAVPMAFCQPMFLSSPGYWLAATQKGYTIVTLPFSTFRFSIWDFDVFQNHKSSWRKFPPGTFFL